MTPGLKLGPMTLVVLYFMASVGIMVGAGVGYHADSAANATVEYNADTNELTVGNETVDVYASEEDIELDGSARGPGAQNNSQILSERGERWFGEDPYAAEEMGDEMIDEDALDRLTPQVVDDGAMRLRGETVDFVLQTTADVANAASSITYQYQDETSWEVVYTVTTTILFAPLLAALYVMVRRVFG